MASHTIAALNQAESLMRTDPRSDAPLAVDFPLVFGPQAPGQLITVDEEVDGEQQIRAMCGILVREFVTPSARLRVGLIGSVITDPEHRGKGWGRALLTKAESALREQECLMSMLWADDAGFYQSLGYAEVGTEYDYLLDPCISAILPSMQGVREMVDTDLDALMRLHSGREVRVERTTEEMRTLLAMPGVEVLVRELEGELCAYSCLGRGSDFASVVHEWAGQGEHILSLLQGHIQRRAEMGDIDPLVVMVSEEDAGMRQFFEMIDAHSVCGILGLAKGLSCKATAEVLEKIVGDRVGVEAAADGELILTGPEGKVTVSNDEMIVTLLEPRGQREAVETLERNLGVELPELPLRPFVWGLDSI